MTTMDTSMDADTSAFAAAQQAMRQQGGTSGSANSIRVTGENGDMIKYLVNGIPFEVTRRYLLLEPIGIGAYGIVCSAQDTLTGGKVAIKKIPRAFENLKDTKRTLREIRLLRHFVHDNILSVKDILAAANGRFDDVYLVTELMDTDLHQIIASPQPLSDDHCQYFIYQVLRGLKHIHSAHVIHRDLKPSNMLVNKDCLLKICDFGLARHVAQAPGSGEEASNINMTEYVATRWYRAPEVILSWKKYTKAIDMWSVGCIFAELLVRKPLFQGKDYIHQLTRIFEIMGTPTEEQIQRMGNEQARRFIRQLGYKERVALERIFPAASKLALDLLERMLTFDPNERITVDEALAHPYLAQLHDPLDEPLCSSELNVCEFENFNLTKEVYKDLVAREMLAFHPEALDQFPLLNDAQMQQY